MPAFNRLAAVCALVATLHMLALWALQAGLALPVREIVTPVRLLVTTRDESPTVKMPALAPMASVRPTAPVPARLPLREHAAPPSPTLNRAIPSTEGTAPMAATTAPAAAGPTSTLQPAMVALPGAAEPAALAGPTAPNSNAPGGLAASVEVPTVAASYQHKPLPPYPPMSKRLGEQGTALVEVWIGSDGLPKQASVRKSSGFERLDKASVDAVMAWRYNPGKRGSTPEAMAMLIPLQWVNQ